jgi:hypothetical protein
MNSIIKIAQYRLILSFCQIAVARNHKIAFYQAERPAAADLDKPDNIEEQKRQQNGPINSVEKYHPVIDPCSKFPP